jgi:SAM-dependent methyltransferase
LAAWWPLLSTPAHYEDEANYIRELVDDACATTPHTMLELGCGGGNNASFLKEHYALTLADRSLGMLAVSRALNPECAHVAGDMRALRLGLTFDAVLIHDAITYMTTADDLRSALLTAFVHCRPGGVAVFLPDDVRESFAATTRHGGHDGIDGDRRALRYLEWTWDPDPSDTTVVVDFALVLREGDGSVRTVYDRHTIGLFPLAVWKQQLVDVGFDVTVHDDRWGRKIFVGVRPAS